jgi:hypothetical protein
VAAQNLHGVTLTGAVRVIVVGRQVCVSISGQVPLIFGRALPGVPRAIAVHATAVATAAGDHGATVPSSAIC